MRDAKHCITVVQGEGERVLTDDTDRSEFNLNTGFAVVAVGRGQKFLGNVISHHVNAVQKLGRYPDPFSLSQRSGRRKQCLCVAQMDGNSTFEQI
jgi:hypothetical protein